MSFLEPVYKENRRGRAELLLADCAADWNTRPVYRQLPSLLQWLQIRFYSEKELSDRAEAEEISQTALSRVRAGVKPVTAVALLALGSGKALVEWKPGSFEITC